MERVSYENSQSNLYLLRGHGGGEMEEIQKKSKTKFALVEIGR